MSKGGARVREGRLSRSAGLVLAAVILLGSSLTTTSCGKEESGQGPAPSSEGGIQVGVADRSDVDSLLKDLDRAMDSVSPEDFSDSQLAESELGL